MPVRPRALAVLVVVAVICSVVVWSAPAPSLASPSAPEPEASSPTSVEVPAMVGEPPAHGSSTAADGPELVTFEPPATPKADPPAVKVMTGQPPSDNPIGFVPGESVEDPAARDVGSRTYVNGDGSRTLEMSTEPLNYRDRAGRWVPVDNRLVAGRDGSVSNGANEWGVTFGALSSGVTVVTGQGPVFGWRARATQSGVMPTIEPDGVSVRYTDAWPGVDLVYRVSGSTVKELIELKTADARSTFEFDVRGAAFTGDPVKGWTATAIKGGNVRLLAPLSFDSHGVGIDDRVSMDVTAHTKGADDVVPAVRGRAADANQVVRFGVDQQWLA